MTLDIKQYLRQPSRYELLDAYMLEIEQIKSVLAEFARNRYPRSYRDSQRRRDTYRDEYRASDRDNRRSDNRDGRRSDTYRRDDRRDTRQADRPRQQYRETSRTRYLDSYRPARDGNRDRRDDRRRDDRRDDRRRDDLRDDRRDRDRKNERAHFADSGPGSDADESDSASEVSDTPSSDEESVPAHFVIDAGLTCNRCHRTFDTRQTRKAHGRNCVLTKASQHEVLKNPSPLAESERTCCGCHEVFASRKKLFKHLRDRGECQTAAPRSQSRRSPTKPQGAGESNNVAELPTPSAKTAPALKEAPPLGPNDATVLSSYTFLRVKARPTPEGEDIEVCIDPGTGRTLIGRSYLQSLDHTVERRKGKVKGVGNGTVRVDQWATFTYHLPGRDKDGNPVIMKFRKSGWVVDDDLEPNLLLGNDTLHPYQASISYETSSVAFAAFDGFTIDFDVHRRGKACVRKVACAIKATLPPGKTIHVPVDYKPLPDDRSFTFESEHPLAMHAIVDSKTPRVVVMKNTTNQTIVIPQHTKLGYICEGMDSGYYAGSWSGGMKALAMAAMAATGLGATATAAHIPTADTVSPGAYSATSEVVPVNAQFDMTPVMIAVATGTVPSHPVFDMTEQLSVTPTFAANESSAPQVSSEMGTSEKRDAKTPFTDAVHDILQQSGNYDELPGLDPPDPGKPRIPDVLSTLGIRIPENLPEMVTSEGVHVYNADTAFASRLEKVVHKFPKLWVDQGTVDIPLDEQKQKMHTRAYPLSRKD